jgi:hypothetical protein
MFDYMFIAVIFFVLSGALTILKSRSMTNQVPWRPPARSLPPHSCSAARVRTHRAGHKCP